MKKKDQNPLPSIFRITLLEILLGIATGILMTWSYRTVLWSLQPYTFEESHMSWFTQFRSDLLTRLGWFYFLLGFLTAVSLLRFIRKQNHLVPFMGQISPRGYLAMTWPILLVIPDLQLVFSFSLFISCPICFVIAFVICAYSIREYSNRGDLLPILFNVAVTGPLIFNTIGVWALIGD